MYALLGPRSGRVLILALLGACSGKDGDAPTDSGTDPTTSETGTLPPADGPLEVTVASREGPFVGAVVAFYDAEGTIVGTESTDGTGVATWPDFPVGGAITVGATSATDNILTTAFDLAPGAHRVDPTAGASGPDVGQIEITIPAAPPGGDDYQLRTGCGVTFVGPGSTSTMGVGSRCADAEGRFSVLAIAEDVDNAPVAYSAQTDIFVGSVSPAVVELGPWQTDFASLSITGSNPPATIDRVIASTSSLRDGVLLYSDQPDSISAPGPYTFALEHTVASLGSVSGQLIVEYVTTGSFSRSAYLQGLAQVPVSLNVDLSTQVPGRIHEVDIDVAAGEVTWTLDGQHPDVDGMLVLLSWELGGVDYEWQLYGPGLSGSSLTLPALPATLEAWRFSSPGDLTTTPSVGLFGSTLADGWSGLRDVSPPALVLNLAGGEPPFEAVIALGG